MAQSGSLPSVRPAVAIDGEAGVAVLFAAKLSTSSHLARWVGWTQRERVMSPVVPRPFRCLLWTVLGLFLWASTPTRAAADTGLPIGWAQASATEQLRVGRMIVYHEPGLEDEAQAMLSELPTLWSRLEGTMGRDLDDTLRIRYVEHAGQVARATGMPKWVAGVARSSTGDIMLARFGPDGSRTNLDALLMHELTHVALYRATNGAPVPRWFNEGVADSLSEEIDLLATDRLAGAVFGAGVPVLDELDATFRADREQVALAYATSRDFLTYLRYYDPKRRAFSDLLFGLRAGLGFETAVLTAYGKGLHELDAQWRGGLMARFAWFPLLSAEGMPFVVVGPLVAVAWWRRRRFMRRAWDRLAAEDAVSPTEVAAWSSRATAG